MLQEPSVSMEKGAPTRQNYCRGLNEYQSLWSREPDTGTVSSTSNIPQNGIGTCLDLCTMLESS